MSRLLSFSRSCLHSKAKGYYVMAAGLVRWRHRWFPVGLTVYYGHDHYLFHHTAKNGFTIDGALVPSEACEGETHFARVMNYWRARRMKRKDLKSLPGLERHAEPATLESLFPNLAEWMTASTFEGSDEKRESPTVTIWAAGGQWRLSLKDREECLVMWLAAEKLLELLQMADLYVMDGAAPWRHDDARHERNGKRVQKKT